MRPVFLTTAGLLAVCFIGTAGFAQTVTGSYSTLYSSGIYGAPACTGPGYCGPLVPGCCEYAPNCRCAHIWDGYCQEKNNGCGWPALCLPCFKFHRSCSHTTASACSTSGDACCVEDGGSVQTTVESSGKTLEPAPSIKTAPPKPADSESTSKAKAKSAWLFLPAGSRVNKF